MTIQQWVKLIDNMTHIAVMIAVSCIGFQRWKIGQEDPFIPLIFVVLYAISLTLGQIRRLMMNAKP